MGVVVVTLDLWGYGGDVLDGCGGGGKLWRGGV